MLEVDRKTVDNWENDRTYPRSSIGAIELVLGVNLTDDQGVSPSVTPDEAFILSLDRFTEDEKRRLVDALRDWRGARHA